MTNPKKQCQGLNQSESNCHIKKTLQFRTTKNDTFSNLFSFKIIDDDIGLGSCMASIENEAMVELINGADAPIVVSGLLTSYVELTSTFTE